MGGVAVIQGKSFRPATLFALAMTSAAVLAAQTAGLIADRYSLMVEGREIASFSELQGIRTEVTPVETVPSPTKWGDIVLKRGLTPGIEMSSWLEAAQAGGVAGARKNASITMYDTMGKPVARYHLENAWPAKIEIGALKAGASEVLMETVTISAERIQRVAP